MAQMYFDVWAGDDMQGTALGELTDASNKHIRKAFNAIGNGQFTINRHSSQFAWVAQDNVVRVRREAGGPFAYDDSRYFYAFVIEEGSDSLVSRDEQGGEDVTRGGRDLGAVLLWRAVIYPYSSVSGNETYWARAYKDGVMRVPLRSDGTGRNAGTVLRILENDAENRTPSPIAPLQQTFTFKFDSNDVDWTENGVAWEFPVGSNLLDVVAILVSSGLIVAWDAVPLLHAYNSDPSSDLSATIDFTQGDNIREVADRIIHASPAVSRALVKGTTTTDELKFREVIDATVETALGGRREAFVEYQATPTNAQLDLAGQKYINVQKDQHDGPTTLGAYDTAGRTAFVDYFPGDTVTVDIPGVWDAQAEKIIAINLDDTESGEYDPTLEFLESPWDGQQLDSLGQPTGGTGGGNCRDCPPLEPYDPTVPTVPTPCDDGTPGLAAQSFWPLGGSGSTANPTPSPGIVYYFRAGGTENMCPTEGSGGAWHFPTFGAGGEGTEDEAGRNSGNELHVRVQGPGTITLDANTTGDTAAEWSLLHGTVSAAVHSSGSGVPSSVDVDIDCGFCCHRLEVRVGAGTTGAFLFRGGTWTPTSSGETNPPIPGQQGNEEIPGVIAATTYTTNFPYVPGSLQVWVDGVAVVPNETDPDAGEFTLPIDATGKDVVVKYTIASATGTGATNPPPTTTDVHITDADDAHDASAISFVPAGTIAATNVQAAIEEVAAEAGGGYVDPLTTRGDLVYRDASATTRLPIGAAGQHLVSDGTDAAWAADYASIVIIIDGGGSVPSTGVKADVSIPFACRIERARLLADQSGDAVVDVWRDSYANYPPTVADTITAAAKPTLSAADKSSDITLTGWSRDIAEGDTLRFNLDSVATVTRLMVELRVRKT